MGWALNDLRSNRKLAPVPDQNQPTITRTPPRSRPSSGEVDEDTKELKRRRKDSRKAQRLAERNVKAVAEPESQDSDPDSGPVSGSGPDADLDGTVEIEIDLQAVPTIEPEESPAAVESRPARRRDVEDEDDEEKFPWHHQFEDDEPEELQATSPLLSRAFRATTG